MQVLECVDCEWQGRPTDLEAIVEEPTSINDYTHCPECAGTEFVTVVADFTLSDADEEAGVRY